jgi:hypothetical protein
MPITSGPVSSGENDKKQKTILVKVKLFLFLIFLPVFNAVQGKTLPVGIGHTYASIQEASLLAEPGDKILVYAGIYENRENISFLRGNEQNPVYLIAERPGEVVYRGNTEAWHLSSCAHLYINGFVFEQQSANGVNIDDNGNDDASSHHIIMENCTFRDMHASGNNDLLKLSGLYHFEINNCRFQNGATGGSGIDMVGCHYGEFHENEFVEMGSNCIQAKGGSQHLLIRNNMFKDGGQRALNLGGSTGLAYFRPIDATFEAADILVHSNVFVRGWAPIAYVGSVRVRVINNTIVDPENWVIRILQETVDTSRFESCGGNEFSNNIIYFGEEVNRIVNVGPNTRPESFLFSNNLWYHKDNPEFQGPNLPVSESNGVVQLNPLFKDYNHEIYELDEGSPAIAKGKPIPEIELDHSHRYFDHFPCIGAFEPKGIYKDFSGEVGSEWWYRYDFGYSLYRIKEKYIKDDQEVSTINNFVHVGDATGDFEEPDFYMRDNKFYLKTREQDNFSLYYDFNLEKGDTLSAVQGWLTSLVDSVDYLFLAGRVRKILYTSPLKDLSSFDLNYGTPGKLIEGIYSIHTKMEGNNYYEENSEAYITYELLRCFIEYDEIGAVVHEIHFREEECDKIILPSSEEVAIDFTIYPNPIGDHLTIESEFYKDNAFSVLNMEGVIVKNGRIKSGRIELQSLNPGPYLLVLMDENGQRDAIIRILKL